MTRMRGLIGPLVAFLVGLLIARRGLDVVEVRGRSMLPTLHPGDRLLALRLHRSPRPGEVVLAPDPRNPARELVKRVRSIDASGVTLAGDNPAFSTDARVFGAIGVDRIEWRVVARYWPLGRVGRIGVRGQPQATATASTQPATSDGTSSTSEPASAATR